MTGSTEVLDNQPNGKFLCGVVEGEIQNGDRHFPFSLVCEVNRTD